MFNDKNILITGGTGSFGKKAVEAILKKYKPNKIIVFSRDELKQFEMQAKLKELDTENRIRYFIGDIRDLDRLMEAFHGVDYIIHAAALKQVPACEYNPFEAIKTNVLGGQNVIQAAIRSGVKKVIALSTDKAAAPVNLYGATKLCSDKLFIDGNQMSASRTGGCQLSVVRYGNVLGSRGSVIPFFLNKRNDKTLPITDDRMTRFSITLEDAVEFTLDKFSKMHGGELFVPKIPSYKIMDIAKAIAPNAEPEIIGIRPGEKLHECMITEDDSRQALEFDSYFAILPDLDWYTHAYKVESMGGKPCAEDFNYNSGNNTEWLTIDELRTMINDFCVEYGYEKL